MAAAVAASTSTAPAGPVVSLLDYGAGNVRSVRNAIRACGYELRDVETAEDIDQATVLVFPGVGSFGSAVETLQSRGWMEPLRRYLLADRPFFGICLGMQTLFESSDESPGLAGLGIIPGVVGRFAPSADDGQRLAVPQIGWNTVTRAKPDVGGLFAGLEVDARVYFVHSFRATPSPANADWVQSTTAYGGQFVSSVQRGNVAATQFHPEKSGAVGLTILRNFLGAHVAPAAKATPSPTRPLSAASAAAPAVGPTLAKRVIACLDVRSNDQGDLVVTKGDQYDVREGPGPSADGRGAVRNLGKPVALAQRYYDEGADEVVFLNITSFRQGVLDDLPMLQVLERSSEHIFVPLTVGGGIRDYTDADGRTWSALDVAARYFRAGADKVSLGSDAVYASEQLLAADGVATGESAIEQISHVYGRQAVVISIDPKRVYVPSPDAAPGRAVVAAPEPDEAGNCFCWYQATVKGGREARDIDAVAVAKCCEQLGAGEIMLNCIDADGQGRGYELGLVAAVMEAVSIPVIASSGAGAPAHFTQVFQRTGVQAALAAGMFHRNEVSIEQVKGDMLQAGLPCRSAW